MEIAIITILALLVLVALWAIGVYNGLVRMRNQIEEAWRQVDVELHRRYDLIPNLVETVRGYAAHEAGVFEAVTQARAAAAQPQPTLEARAEAENALTATIGRLFAVAEAYPELKANTNFQALQGELTNTEDRIANGRRYYNASVREFNTRIETFPPSIIASMFGFKRAAYFEAEGASRDVVTVDFGQGGGSQPGNTQGGGWNAPGTPGGSQNNPLQQQQTTAGPFGGPTSGPAGAPASPGPAAGAPGAPDPGTAVPGTDPGPFDTQEGSSPESFARPTEDGPPGEPPPGRDDGPIQPGTQPENPR